jgi:hypothetical protein
LIKKEKTLSQDWRERTQEQANRQKLEREEEARRAEAERTAIKAESERAEERGYQTNLKKLKKNLSVMCAARKQTVPERIMSSLIMTT